MKNKKQTWIILDWAGNRIKFRGFPNTFDSFEDAEDVLCEVLNDDYETDRGEYEIVLQGDK